MCCHRQFFLALAVATLVHGEAAAQKAPVDLGWDAAITERRQLVITSVRAKVDWTGQLDRFLDISSMGAGDTAKLALQAELGTLAPGWEYFSAPVNDTGVITVETRRSAIASAQSSSIEIPYAVRATGAIFDLARASADQADFDPNALKLLTSTFALRQGYSGSVRIRLLPHGTTAEAMLGARLRLRAQGGVTILGNQSLVDSSSTGDVARSRRVAFAMPLGAKGIIEADITLPNATTVSRYRATRLYLFASRRRLYTGASGFAELQIRELDDQRGARELSASEYNRRLQAILGQGTRQTVSTEPDR